jgi:hypothetical protein
VKLSFAALSLLAALSLPTLAAAQAAPPAVVLDHDGDGLADAEEDALATAPHGDSDGDGTPDRLDADDDGDEIPTVEERPGGVNQDTDGDGRFDHLDADDDNDGVPTRDERDRGMSRDSDADGYADHLEADDGAERAMPTPAAHVAPAAVPDQRGNYPICSLVLSVIPGVASKVRMCERILENFLDSIAL